MMASFRSERFSKWPIFDVIDLEVANFYQFTISEVTHLRTFLISKWSFSNRHIFEVTLFLIDTFPKILILEMVNFSIRMIFDFQNDPFWNLPNFEVIFFELTHFQSDSFPNWPIPEVTNSRNSDFSQVNHFRSYLFWCDRLRRSLFSKWTIFEANHFRSDPFKMNNFLEVTHF